MSTEAEESFRELASSQLGQFETPWFKYFIQYDPREDLSQAQCPVLAMIGEHDLQVLVEPNLQALKQALADAGVAGSRCERLAGLNHLFQESETGLPTEYGTIEQTFAPQALEMIADWISAH